MKALRPINRSSEVPAVEGGVGLYLDYLFGLVAVAQSHEGVDHVALGSMVADDLPESDSVNEGSGAVAVGSEEGVGGADHSCSVKVIPVLLPGVGVEKAACLVSEVCVGDFHIVPASGPGPSPGCLVDVFPSGSQLVSEAKVSRDDEWVDIVGLVVELLLGNPPISQPAEGHHGDLPRRSAVAGNGVEGSVGIGVLMDVEEAI